MLSMTGYAKQDFKILNQRLSVLIKSLNSNKGLDISVKTPRYLMHLESDIRKLIENKLIRGKIQFIIIEHGHASKAVFNQDKLYLNIERMRKIVPDADSGSLLNAAFKLPDIFSSEIAGICNAKNIKKEILNSVEITLKNTIKYRKKEGKILTKEIKKYINNILKISRQIKLLEKPRLKRKKDKIISSIKKNIKATDYNQSQLELEMIYYFEKNDITEERVRLQHHCQFFIENSKKNGVVGKKLIFIAQEILREINTIGAKANDFEIQKRVVLMKEEIDKTKEQLQNIL